MKPAKPRYSPPKPRKDAAAAIARVRRVDQLLAEGSKSQREIARLLDCDEATVRRDRFATAH